MNNNQKRIRKQIKKHGEAKVPVKNYAGITNKLGMGKVPETAFRTRKF